MDNSRLDHRNEKRADLSPIDPRREKIRRVIDAGTPNIDEAITRILAALDTKDQSMDDARNGAVNHGMFVDLHKD
jgi:hypothetical protein